MARTTITLPTELLDALQVEVRARSKTDAVITAIKDEIRIKKLERIRRMAGKIEFTATAEQLRHGDKRLG